MSACEGEEIVMSSVNNQCKMKKISIYFGNIMDVKHRLSEIDVSTPELPCRKKVPL